MIEVEYAIEDERLCDSILLVFAFVSRVLHHGTEDHDHVAS
jgi:hypothetical protein